VFSLLLFLPEEKKKYRTKAEDMNGGKEKFIQGKSKNKNSVTFHGRFPLVHEV
jgi:hypothetical protein